MKPCSSPACVLWREREVGAKEGKKETSRGSIATLRVAFAGHLTTTLSQVTLFPIVLGTVRQLGAAPAILSGERRRLSRDLLRAPSRPRRVLVPSIPGASYSRSSVSVHSKSVTPQVLHIGPKGCRLSRIRLARARLAPNHPSARTTDD